MKSKQLTQINKFKKSSLPILEMAVLGHEWLTVCNLTKFGRSVWYQVRHGLNVDGTVLLPVAEFVKIARKFSIERIYGDGPKAIIQTESGRFEYMSENEADFPTVPVGFSGSYPVDAELAKTLDKFASTDDLRPAIMGVYFNSQAVATNGHIMKWKDLETEADPSFILPSGVISLMTEGEYTFLSGGEIKADAREYQGLFSDNENILFDKLDEVYPNYRGVIPEGKPEQVFTLEKKALKKAVEAAGLVYPNRHPHRNLRLVADAGKVTVTAFDIDLSSEYKSKPVGTSREEESYEIGFNGEYILQILKDMPDEIRVTMTTANRAAIWDGNTLLMPVMLDSYA